MKKIAFFDFCETLVNFQTADAFVDFVRAKSGKKRMQRLESIRNTCHQYGIISIINKYLLKDYPLYKITKLLQLRGFDKDELDKYAIDYYNEKIKPNLIPDIINILKNKQDNGFKIVIVSGGYDIYLKFFVEDFCIDQVVSSKIEFKNEKCTGLLDGPDCMNVNKVIIMERLFDKERFYSEAYSDSISDLPLLTWVDQGYVVSREKHQKWLNNYNHLNEIIWKES